VSAWGRRWLSQREGALGGTEGRALKLRKLPGRIVALLLIAATLVVAAIVGRGFLAASRTIFQLLSENKKLKQAIANLTAESQIGYAKVLSQTEREGRTVTRLLFVETARDDPTRHIFEKRCEVEGDVVYFDALVVKFSDPYVMDGRERALYLWRRVFGEKMAPESGYPIEEAGAEPRRYADLLRKLRLRDRRLFWTEIWDLSNNPDKLRAAGIKALHGKAVYKSLRPDFIYLFKIANMGDLYIETVPAP
jgi:hypothetical protein